MSNWTENKLAWDFIEKNLSQDVQGLRLKFGNDSTLPYSTLIQQIESWQKLLKKFQKFSFQPGWVMPPFISIEQASSIETAAYKGQHFSEKKVVDVTGGMGIDAFVFSQTAREVTHVEREKEIQQSASTLLSTTENTFSLCCDGDDFLRQADQNFDVLYADPARRGSKGEKVFHFSQLTPNPLEKIDFWLSFAKEVWIKLSPMTDLFEIIKHFPQTSQIHVLGKNREAKEIVIMITNQVVEDIEIQISVNSQYPAPISFSAHEINTLSTSSIPLEKYLYDPHPAVKIARPWQYLCDTFEISPIHPQTRLFTSNNLEKHFPGRVFEIIEVLDKIPKTIKGKNLTIATQNHRAKAADLKSKYKCKESEVDFLWATKTVKGYQYLLAKKVF